MIDLTDTLDSLHDTDVVVAKLNGLVPDAAAGDILRINLEALAKRRRDLERRLGAQLRNDQLDLVEYRIDAPDGGNCAAMAAARAIQHFQEMTTCVFDAVRTSPKRTYRPSRENIELSTMTLAGARIGSAAMMSLSIPNERLIAIQSDLDAAFELVFELLRVRTQGQLFTVQARTGAAALSRAYAWAQNSIEYGLATSISWQKSAVISESVGIAQNDALLLQKTIENTSVEQVDEIEQQCVLLTLNNASSSFALQMAGGNEISGLLANEFPRGAWTIHADYMASLTRRLRVRCSTGEETTRWTLNALMPYS